IVRSANGRFP
ncbi:unnamed protein product, partial [Rotaria sordida]